MENNKDDRSKDGETLKTAVLMNDKSNICRYF